MGCSRGQPASRRHVPPSFTAYLRTSWCSTHPSHKLIPPMSKTSRSPCSNCYDSVIFHFRRNGKRKKSPVRMGNTKDTTVSSSCTLNSARILLSLSTQKNTKRFPPCRGFASIACKEKNLGHPICQSKLKESSDLSPPDEAPVQEESSKYTWLKAVQSQPLAIWQVIT